MSKLKILKVLILTIISICLLLMFSFLAACSETTTIEPVDDQLSKDFTDLKGTKEVTINMKDISYELPKILIDSGTTVTWINLDDIGHTVNSDPHPGHDNHPELNSTYLSGGDTFSFTFDEPGLYTYHCTPHYETMKGSVLVE